MSSELLEELLNGDIYEYLDGNEEKTTFLTEFSQDIKNMKDLISSELKDSNNVIERSEILRKIYINAITNSGYEPDPETVLYNFPIVPRDKKLLGKYITESFFMKFLEKNGEIYEIRLDGTSKYEELNTLVKVLGPSLDFIKMRLVYTKYSENNIQFKHLIHNCQYSKEYKYIQNGYTQLIFISEVYHSMWHINTALILKIVNLTLEDKELLDVFNIASKNVESLGKFFEGIIFGTPVLFNQILNNNQDFVNFKLSYIKNFFKDFDIKTIFRKYISHDIFENCCTGMESNIAVIENFTKSLKIEESYEKLLQMLLVIGSSFHSTVFEYQKLFFTSIFYDNPETNKLVFALIVITMSRNIDIVFGDTNLYFGNKYVLQISNLYKNINEMRIEIGKIIDADKIYKNNIFNTKEKMIEYFSTNSYTTYI